MNGYQIATFLTLDDKTSKCFQGFVMQDSMKLPLKSDKSSSLVILNTDTESGRGEHWCVIFLESNICNFEFFDPFGFTPSFYGVSHLFYEFDNNILYSKKCVQSPFSNVCGAHCLFYAYNRCRGKSMEEILSIYDWNLDKNDFMVSNFVRQFGKIYHIK